jgi:hypothetical protein
MKRILFAGLLAVAALGLGESTASAICFDCYRPCVRVPLPRLPIFCPKLCITCDPEGRTGCCGQKGGTLLYNNAYALQGGGHGGCGHGGHGCQSCGSHPLFGKFHGGGGNCQPHFGYPDCNRPMYPNPGYGYYCWHGVVAPWYGYWPPSAPTGYQIGAYGAFRGPTGPAAAAYANTGVNPAGYNVPSYWYGR